MKRMKKAVALLLTLLMTLSLTVTAFAAGTVDKDYNQTNGATATDGTITITGIHTDSGTPHTKYEVYKMLHLESYKVGTGVSDPDAYSYVMVTEWEDFFRNNTVAKKYITISSSNYVTWTGGKTAENLNEFAEAALNYAKTRTPVIQPVMTSDTGFTGDIALGTAHGYKVDGTNGTFHGLSLGYYLIDSNVGILCGLTTTNPNATVNAKNGAPTLEKQVQEDSALESGTASWFDHNTADIGQTVKYDITINAYAGAEDYVFHDKMGTGLTYDNHLEVYYFDPSSGLDKDKLDLGTEYTVDSAPTDGCTFHIVFNQDFLDTLNTNDKIYITYQAILNKNAVVGGSGNINESWLDYGENHHTTHDTTTTYTYGFDLVKTNSADKLLPGAQFKLYNHETLRTDEHLVKFVYDGTNTYRRATAADDPANIKDTLIVNDGNIAIHGLDNGRYYLVETAAPAGYNALEGSVLVAIADGYRDAVVAGDTLTGGTNPVQIINNTGAVLPHTGGMGTTIFVTGGMIAVLAAGVLLVTKKRMGMIED